MRTTRRSMLAMMAGSVALAACGRTSLHTSPASRLPVYIPSLKSQAEEDDFGRFDPEIEPLGQADYDRLLATGVVTSWQILDVRPYLPTAPASMVLSAALDQVNFDVRQLLRGALDAFSAQGVPYAMPYAIWPLAVRYRPDAFVMAGVAAPDPQWTLDVFDDTCAKLRVAVDAGRLAAYPHVLAPVDDWEALATGFALGHGAPLARSGTFDLASAGVVEGLARLRDIWAMYTDGRVAHPTGADAEAAGAALQFITFPPAGNSMKGWHWARFPRMPASPVVPATVYAWSSEYAAKDGAATPDYELPLPGTPVPDAVHRAVVRLWMWTDARIRANPRLAPAPPATADRTVQAAYWSAMGAASPGAEAVGDWAHYAFVGQGWPPTVASVGDTLRDALENAPSADTLTATLAHAGDLLNQDAASYAAARSEAAGASTERAAGAAEFPVAGSRQGTG